MNVGIYNANAQTEIEEMIGAEIGTKILAAIGRDKTGAPAQAEAPKPAPAAQIAPAQAPIASTQAQKVEAKPQMTTAEMQRALATLKYQPGATDGMMGRRTVDALKKFQSDNGLPQSAQLNSETQAKLLEKTGSASK